MCAFTGAKFVMLKEKLKEKIKVKRQEARLERQELETLDNEEGYEGTFLCHLQPNSCTYLCVCVTKFYIQFISALCIL